MNMLPRMGGRVVEGARLESVWARKGLASSNLAPSVVTPRSDITVGAGRFVLQIIEKREALQIIVPSAVQFRRCRSISDVVGFDFMGNAFNASVAIIIAAGTLGAQSVSGTVVRPDSLTPAAGVVVVLIGERSETIVSRAATASRGQFQLRAPSDGRYRLRVLQLGQRPTTVGPFDLRADRPLVERVVLQHQPITLARFDVRAQNQCRVRPDSGLLVAQLLAEAHKVLLASVASTSDGEVRAEYELESRAEDTRRRLLSVDDRRTVSRVTTRPFASLPPDSIAAIGYVTNVGDSLEYRGPDAEVLLSDAFAAQHCFRVVEGSGERAGLYGVVFQPVKARRGIVDIRGTMWVDPKTSALQHVEFVYDPSTGDEQRAGVGGDVRFARTQSGLWFVSQWSIRMPRVAIRRIPARVAPRPTPARTETFVEGVQVTSGEVVSVHAEDVVLYQRAAGISIIASDPPESGTTNDPNGIVRRVCGIVGAETDSGAVFGRVTTDGDIGVPRMPIFAEWREEFRLIGSSLITYKSFQRSAQTVAGGDYVLCDVPLRLPVTVFTHVNGKRVNWPEVRLTDGAPVAARNYVLPRIANVVATAGDCGIALVTAIPQRPAARVRGSRTPDLLVRRAPWILQALSIQ